MKKLDVEPSTAVTKILDTGIQTQPADSAWYKTEQQTLPPPPHATMTDALAHAALRVGVGAHLLGENPDDPTIARSYADIDRAARRLAQRFADRGVEPGDRVLMVLPTSYDFIVTFFAAQLCGAVPVPTYPPALMERAELAIERMSHIALKVRARFVITTSRLMPLLGELGLRLKCMRELWASETLIDEALFSAPDPGSAPYRPKPDDTAFIQFTSGSTGHPKGVVITHGNAVSNAWAMGLSAGTSERDVAASWLPLYHDMGLIGGIFSPIYFRYPLVLMSPTAFLLRPRRWLEAITTFRATMTACPNFGFAMCVRRVRPAERQGLDLSSWRLAYNGAEPINLRTVIDFTKAYEPYGFRLQSMFPVYGLAECTLAVTYAPPGEPFKFKTLDRAALVRGEAISAEGKGTVSVVCVGKAIAGHRVHIVDEQGKATGDRKIGQVLVSGPSVMRGYYDDDEATARVIRDGWLHTGDLGFSSNGGLYITGRQKDLIIVRGHNYYAEDLERVVERLDGVRGGCVVAFSIYDDEAAVDRVVMVCESRAAQQAKAELADRIGAAVQEACGLRVDQVVVVPPGTVPKTSSGKRQRDLCRQLHQKDELRPRRTSKLDLAWVFVRSGLGFVAHKARRMMR